MMRRMISALAALVLLTALCVPVRAAGSVTYSGNAGSFVFEPGSDHSPTDLFTDFKQVMPGDDLTQSVVLRSRADGTVQVKVFLRALGPHDAQSDAELLSQLTLTVRAGESTLFHAPSHETAQLTDWVSLGVLEAGGSVELEVTLHVPTALDNRFMDRVGLLDWQFMVEEYPVQGPDTPPVDPDKPPVDPDVPPVDPEVPPADPDTPPDKPDVPKTGDEVPVDLYTGLFLGSGLLLAIVLFVLLRSRKRRPEEPS
ncbi:MAG: sortase B protein-sorting domain-containing protein [Oscillospiraceae bacterium]|nr:sortase B protein-sorting domain-containing protein [Oscillospiraceae bacterium]